MDALIQAIKQNVIAAIAIGAICLAFLGFVVVPGLTSGSGSGSNQQATATTQTVAKEVVASQKTEAAQDSNVVQGATSPTAVATATPSATAQSDTEYVVKAGDTLVAIAAQFGTTVQAIVTYNGLANENSLSIGQKLKIPGSSTSQQVPTPKPTNTSSAQVVVQSTPTTAPTTMPTTKSTSTPTPVPVATNTPKPTNTPPPPTATPVPAVNYLLTQNRRLSACENNGMLRVHIWVYDKNGNPMNGIRILRLTSSDEWPAYTETGTKGDGQAEFDLQAGTPAGGSWKVKVDMPNQTSQWADNLATDLWLDEYCGDHLGNFHGHISYDVKFQYQG